MENYCMVASKYYEENPEEAYSCDTSGHPEYRSSYADDDHYFEIDISIPFSPADAIPFSSLNHDDSEDEFDLDLSIYTAPPPSPDLCSSPAGNLCYQSQLLPLQLLTQPLDDTYIDITFPQSRDVPGVKFQYPKLIEIAAKPSMELQSAKPSMDVQSPRTKCVDGLQKKSKDSDHGEGLRKNMDRNKKRDKEMIHKYVNKIKPLYDKISQRGCNEKIRCGDLDQKPRIAKGHKICCWPGSERSVKQISFSCFFGKLTMAYEHLDKGKEPPSEMQRKLPEYSSDSTWMEVQSAIEGAIVHCKQSNLLEY